MKYLLLPLLLIAAPATASPLFLPSHDVTVTYAVAVPGQDPVSAELSYSADSEQARIDSPDGYYVLANLAAGRATLVVPALHALVEAPDFSLLAGELRHAGTARFAPQGESHYAGRSCENYTVHDADGTAHVCLTQDGIVLHFAGHNARGTADVTAEQVVSGPVEDDLFTQPEGYNPITLPPGALQALLTPQ